MNTDTPWHVVKTARFKEHYVELQLSGMADSEAYLPIVKISSRRQGRNQTEFEPLFPGYVFARFDITRGLLYFRRLHAVISLLTFDGRPAQVPCPVIEDLKRRERGRGYISLHSIRPPLPPNCAVTVVGGLFRGHSGVFLRYASAMQRVQVLLDVLHSSRVLLDLPVDAVQTNS